MWNDDRSFIIVQTLVIKKRKRRKEKKKLLFLLHIKAGSFVRLFFLLFFLSLSSSFIIDRARIAVVSTVDVMRPKLKRIVCWLVDEEDGIERTSNVIRIYGRCQCSFFLSRLPSFCL
jgi:hypothetical protein